MTPFEFDERLRAAKNPSGGPFDLDGFKRFKQETRYWEALEELKKREVSFGYTDSGQPALSRTSIWMFIYFEPLWFTGIHSMRDDKILVRDMHGQAGSETLMCGESEDKGELWRAAKRGFWQEFKIKVEREHLDFELLLKTYHRTITRPSSVYPGFISSTLIYPVVADLAHVGYQTRPWPNGDWIQDTTKKTWCEWREGLGRIEKLRAQTGDHRLKNHLAAQYGELPPQNPELEELITQRIKSP